MKDNTDIIELEQQAKYAITFMRGAYHDLQARNDKLTEMLHHAFTEGYRAPREGMIGLERGWERSDTKKNLETL